MSIRLRVAHLLVLTLLACCLTTQLPAPTDLGALKGHVQDQRGGAITNAAVTLRNPSTAFDRTVQTDSNGNFSFVGVPLTGRYVVSVSAPQFKTAQTDNVQLRAGTTATVDIVLDVSGANTEIKVYGTTETLPTESNQVSTRFGLQKIEDTPVLNNKVTSLPLLNSSVRPAQTTGDLFLNETLFVINGNGADGKLPTSSTTLTLTIAGDGKPCSPPYRLRWCRSLRFTPMPLRRNGDATLVPR